MGVVIFAGAEHGFSGTTSVEESPTATNVSVVSSPVRSGSYAYRVTPVPAASTGSFLFSDYLTTGAIDGSAGASIGTFYCEFGFRYALKSTAATGEEFVDFRILGGSKGQLRLNNDGTIGVYNTSASLVATSVETLEADTWYHIGYMGTSSSVASAYELRLNDRVILSGTMTQGSAAFFGPRLGKNTNRNSTSVDYFYDDLIISDDGFLGSKYSVGILVPGGHGSSMTWTSGTGASDFTQVYERPASSSNYVKCTSGGAAYFRPQRMDCAEIKAVKVMGVAAEDPAGTSAVITSLIGQNGASTSTTGLDLTSTSWHAFGLMVPTDPDTAGSWSYGKLNNCQFGVSQAAGASVRLHFVALGVVQKVTYPDLTIPPLNLLAQETGTGYDDNNFITDAEFPVAGAPPLVNTTIQYDAAAADLGFAWDMETDPPSFGVAFGDTAGTKWSGPFFEFPGHVDAYTSIDPPSNGVDLSTFTGAGTLTVSSALPFRDPVADGWTRYTAAVERNSDGRRLYFSYSGLTATTFTGVRFLAASSPGSTSVGTSDPVMQERNWRGSTMGVSETQDLSAGYILTDMRPLDANEAAAELVVSSHDADDQSPGTGFRTYSGSTSLSVSSMTVVSGIITVVTSANHGLTRRGQVVLVTGVASPNTDLNSEWIVNRILSPTKFEIWALGHADVTPTGTILVRVASNPKTADPNSAADVSRIPTGAIAVPGAGAASATRHYLWYISHTHWTAGVNVLVSYMGISYSDDDGQTWVQASGSGKVAAGSNGASVTSISTLSASGLTELPTSGAVEVDTSTGFAYFTYTGKSSGNLTGCTLVNGSGSVATGGGIRYAMWGNNATFTAKHQFGWPVRYGGYVYLMTIGGQYRFEEACMCRVPEASVLDISAWTYWNGTSWSSAREDAVPIFGTNENLKLYLGEGHHVAEPSFMLHPGLSRWVSTYYDTAEAKFYIRTAPAPEGPWTRKQEILDPTDFFATSTAYGGMLHPWSGRSPNTPGSLYFHISHTDAYATFLMRATLSEGKWSVGIIEML